MSRRRVGVLMGGWSAERDVSLRMGEGVAAALESRGADLLHLTTRDASLEDVFVHLTGRRLREE